MFFLILVGILAYISFSIIRFSLKTGISPMPTTLKAKKALLAHLPDIIEGKIYELGSGWGTLLFLLSGYYKKKSIVGYEWSPIPWSVCLLRLKLLKFLKKENDIILYNKDFFKDSVADASLLFCYLYPKAMERLKAKLENELAVGAIVITNTFRIPNWIPYKMVCVNDIYDSKLYFYKVVHED